MKKLTNDQQIENCLVGLSMLDDLPKSAFVEELICWRNRPEGELDHTCGSQACFGGWVAVHPHFQKHGIHAATRHTISAYRGQPRTRRITAYYKISEALFGNAMMFNVAHDIRKGDEKKEIKRRLVGALGDLLAQ